MGENPSKRQIKSSPSWVIWRIFFPKNDMKIKIFGYNGMNKCSKLRRKTCQKPNNLLQLLR